LHFSSQSMSESMDVDSTENKDPPSSSPTKKPMDSAKKAELRNRLKQKVLAYRDTVTKGCGSWRCTNPFCKSNSDNAAKTYTDAEASKLALQMVKRKHRPCTDFPARAVSPLTFDAVQILLETKADDSKDDTKAEDEDGDAEVTDVSEVKSDPDPDTEIQIKTESASEPSQHATAEQTVLAAFTHWDILHESFLPSECKQPTDSDAAIDWTELDRTFKAILSKDSLCKDVADILSREMSATLSAYKTRQETPLTLQELRALVILLSCPLICSEDLDCHALLQQLTLILEFVRDHWFANIKILSAWLSQWPAPRLSFLLRCLHQKMTLNLTMAEDEIEDLSDEWRQELKVDDIDDGDERDELQQEVERREQRQREEYMSRDIVPTVKLMSAVWSANEAAHKLSKVCFHNDGLNEAICARTGSRRDIHRRDLIHYRQRDGFTYLDHAWLLTAASLSKYLEFENLVRQHRARRRRMFDLMLNGGMNALSGMHRGQLMEELDLVLRVRRDHIIVDTLGILQLHGTDSLRKRLRIIFDGEQGIDQGGLTKEYFQLIMKELFCPKYGMFVYREESCTFWFNRDALLFSGGDESSMCQNYELVGKLVGIAIYNNTILQLQFPQLLFKRMLGDSSLGMQDLADVDATMAKGLQTLLDMDATENDIEALYCRNMVVRWTNVFGQEQVHELVPGGEKVPLTAENREEYVRLYIEHELGRNGCVSKQMDAFVRGFRSVCDSELFSKFDSEELELLICGSTDFDFAALQRTTKYDDGLHADSRIIKYFWAVAHELSEMDKRKLLSFCTGSDRVPINGLGEVSLTISKNGDDNEKLPTSHTCFNHLLLPEYDSEDILRSRLQTAIQNSEGFGLL